MRDSVTRFNCVCIVFPYINRPYIVKIVTAVYLGFARERVKWFLISNASAANITLSRGQHIARELVAHRVCTKAFSAVPLER